MSSEAAVQIRTPRAGRRRVWLALPLAAALTAGGAIVLVTDDDGREPVPAAGQPTATKPGSGAVRYDGGPEEGSRSPVARSAGPVTRYDGGPEEGSRGAVR